MHKTSLCLQGETMQLRNDNLNLVDIEWQDYMKQIQVTVRSIYIVVVHPFLDSYFQSLMTNACNAWHLDRWHWASWQTEHNWAPSTVQIMVQAVHCTAPGIMGLPHSRPGQRNLRFILWLNESITRILLRGHTSVPCSWHHAGFCSETDQKRNVIADMTYIHPLLRSKTKLSFSIKASPSCRWS